MGLSNVRSTRWRGPTELMFDSRRDGNGCGSFDRRLRGRRGGALVMVVVVLGAVAVMGYAMLASSALKAQSSRSMADAAAAEALAESGMNIALYELSKLFPYNTPEYFGRDGVELALGGSVPGTVEVRVQRLSTHPWEFEVVSTGRAGAGEGAGGMEGIVRRIEARVRVGPGPKIEHAVSYPGNTTIEFGTVIDGDVLATGTLTMGMGEIMRLVRVGGLVDTFNKLTGKQRSLPDPRRIVLPSKENVHEYDVYYQEDGSARTPARATILNEIILSDQTLEGVFRVTGGNVYLDGDVKINGTLIVEDGEVILRGQNNMIAAGPGFPALVIMNGGIRAEESGQVLTVSGTVWASGRIRSSQPLLLTPKLKINGAVIFGPGGGIDFQIGEVTVTLDEPVSVPDLDRSVRRPVTVLSWRE